MEVLGSRFIATIAPASTVEQAKQFIYQIKAEFATATHNVPAYLIGHGASLIAHCHDDGEPSGTAGRPILAVLQGSGLGDVAVIVTRYFGGTKLGTGGLVRAYSEVVRQSLLTLPRAQKQLCHTMMLVLPYSHLERVRLWVAQYQGAILEELFSADILLTLRFPVETSNRFQIDLREFSQGTLSAEIISTEETLLPNN